jgi:hypothetical protein
MAGGFRPAGVSLRQAIAERGPWSLPFNLVFNVCYT